MLHNIKKADSVSRKNYKKISRPSKKDKRHVELVIYKRCLEPNGS